MKTQRLHAVTVGDASYGETIRTAPFVADDGLVGGDLVGGDVGFAPVMGSSLRSSNARSAALTVVAGIGLVVTVARFASAICDTGEPIAFGSGDRCGSARVD